jgi:hypothetical protein
MKLTEIEKIPVSSFRGYDSTAIPTNLKINFKPLPGKSGYFYYLNRTGSVYIVTPDKKKIIAELKLDPYNFPIDNTVQVNTISVDPDYRGQGLGLALYGIVLAVLRKTLVSGDMQTPNGRRMWTILYNLQRQIPNLVVRGYFTIADYDFDDEKDIPIIMGQLGSEYLGQLGLFHVFAFDVNPNIKGKELEATIKTRFSKIYNNDFDIVNSVGLFARIE